MIKTLISLLAAGLMTGCSLTPQYVRPEAPIADTYPVETAGNDTRAATEIGWREFFPDERLQTVIAIALEHNRDLRSAALRIEEARAQYNIQSADLWPNLNLNASENRALTPATLSPTGNALVSII
jgi:multidrug efflux system outer membrane protein